VAQATFYYPSGLALDSSAGLYVADTENQQVRLISPANIVTTVAGTGILGQKDGAALSATFHDPVEVIATATGTVYVADQHNHVIRKIENNQVSTFAGNINVQNGGYLNGSALSALFWLPADVILAPDGALLVADTANNCIREVKDGQVSTLAGVKQAGWVDGPAGSARFDHPTGLALDSTGAILVADRYNHRIRKISGGQVETLAGSGAQGFADGPLKSASFDNPRRIVVDAAGKIYVSDSSNHSIRVIIP
jgi:sugar lactone lactonase YvrE